MSVLLALVIGAGIGASGQYVLRKEADTLLMSTLSGIAGSIIGLAVFVILDFDAVSSALFSLPAIFFCVLGALLAVVIFVSIHQFMEKTMAQHAASKDTDTEDKIEKNPVHKKDGG